MPAGSQSPHWTRIRRVLVSMALARLDDLDHIGRRRLGVQALDQVRALSQHGPLVEVALVGDLVGIDRGWLGEDQAAGNTHRAALRYRVVPRQPIDQGPAYGRLADHVGE